ncbi:phytanoyl-CoA dioxygenase family protein [Sphingopyxis sp. KK2]|uniref:phytanoyl-CoA dioxygenase family protein n=1 Tax=Sphingopyxis sp. KK2 TaxID=1855727 RepID=UPI00097E6FEC|nr:phytanoyl-CoA dioxygenase family protein [Sphingopyxis sp. KK2]
MEESVRKAYREDGAVLMKNVLNAEQLAACRDIYDWIVANPGPNGHALYRGDQKEHISSHVDNANPLVKDRLDRFVATLPLGDLFADLWGSRNVWYFAEEVFLKAGGEGTRTYWHQDTSYLPWAGNHWGNAWISFEPIPKKNALEIIRGSHRGPLYDGTTFSPNDPTDPLHGGDALPRLPDIEAERKADPGKYEVLSWATEPGDVLFLHPGSLHGGANVDADCPERHTLVFRFFGDDATFRPLPAVSKSGYERNGNLFKEEVAKMEPGAPFRASIFPQIVEA